ncbi:hypothetical protein K435DRAFT_867164 [Dendrothele bispora CBS 962.96]|uniref:Mid2 domain-containing protein n=1 Tax=Dendrothele bispora (strain CBS 962.96) TaxID=1314807 RepID=A0A4S8LF34_DENBC|nr:hypothetical protein K435DRAFT_867164 [Dendrothele bispora CBS 962.96]
MLSLTLSAAVVLSLPDFINAYTWQWESVPQQCGNISISVSGGNPPYRVMIIPADSTPFSNGTEVRRILDEQFSSSTINFKLTYPANSNFVTVVSDSSGFGTGGASSTIGVQNSNDTSCFDASHPVSPQWVFNIDPPQQIVQCQSTRLWWAPANVTGTPTFYGVIPGGSAFVIPESNINSQSGTGTGFSWTPNIRAGTPLHIIANDDRGNGTGGSSRITVADSLQNDNSCLNGNSPSTTGSPVAGGSVPSGSGGSSGGSSGSNTGAIVGGVIGGVVLIIALLLALFFFRRRRRSNRNSEKRHVDLLHTDDPEDDRPPARQELPQYYQPEPFIMPDPTSDSGSNRLTYTDGMSEGRPLSASELESSRSGTPDPSGAASSSVGTRKTAPRVFRPVNIIQHDDAGPSQQQLKEEDPETIELPPAYTNIRS